MMLDFKDPKSSIDINLENFHQNNNNIWTGLYTLTKLIGYPLESFKDICNGKMEFEGFIGCSGGLKRKLYNHLLDVFKKLNHLQVELALIKKEQPSTMAKNHNEQLIYNKEINKEISSLTEKYSKSEEQISFLKKEINLLKDELRNKSTNSDKFIENYETLETSLENEILTKDQKLDKHPLKNK